MHNWANYYSVDTVPEFVFFLSSANGGGAERVITTVARHLGSRGYEVTLLLAESSRSQVADDFPELTVRGFDVDRLAHCLVPLVRYLRKINPRVVVSTIYSPNIFAALGHFISRSDARLVLRIANTPSTHLASRSPRHILGRNLLPFAYSQADTIIAISQGVRTDIIESFNVEENKISLIHNPVDLKSIDQHMSASPSYSWFDERNNIDVIVGMGRLTAQKDFSTLLRAFATVRKRRPNTRLAIFGEGEQKENLVELSSSLGIGNYVQFFGYVNNPFKYLARASLFVLSSAWEGFPNALLEALACGCPIVSTNCPSGPSEILQDGEYGIMIPVGDDDEMAVAIIQSLDTYVMTGKLRSRAQDFSVEKIVDEYEAVLTANSKTRVQ